MATGDFTNTDASSEADSGAFSRAIAAKFSNKWAGTVDEQQNSQAFWQDFFREVVGIKDLQEAGIEFEKKVVSSKKGTTTRIDVYWRDTLLVEQKSAGKDLEAAEVQAREYVVSLPPAQRPPVIVICDFVRFRIVDILLNKSHEFLLEALPDNLQHIEAIAKRDAVSATDVQVEADQKAAKLMANLYLQLEKYGYSGHEASVFMVRVLFCLFADDTRMWSGRLFQKLVENTNSEGTDLGPRIANLFALLDTPKNDRKGPQDPFMVDFPYVNGGIFAERIEVINFNGPMRAALIDCCNYDWSKINPTIFGALFQDIKSKDERRALGEHYTTEANIEKTIRPLFLDEINEKLEKAWDSEPKLKEIQRELGSYKILDPACGCGNFLITTYKNLRQLELDILVRLKQLQGTFGQTSLLDVKEDLHVKLEQLYGIEYLEWSAQIAQVAIYLTDHQENLKLETILGTTTNRFPLQHSAKIVKGNALEVDWGTVCPMGDKTIIVGNPPYHGFKNQLDEQREDQKRVWNGAPGSGTTDYVSNWFILGAQLVDRFNARVAFVSTNSLTQGDQPSALWGVIGKLDVQIAFAHRSFIWENSSSGKAGVHCVIIALRKRGTFGDSFIFDYTNHKSIPVVIRAKNINPYLQDKSDVLIKAQKKPIVSHVPRMISGNTPRDGGWLSKIGKDEAQTIRDTDPIAAKYLRKLLGAEELINDRDSRFCLWLVDASPAEIRNSKVLSTKVAQVRAEREGATGPKGAAVDKPSLFAGISQPKSEFIGIPSVSSERRKYIPMAFIQPDEIINNKIFAVVSSDRALFAILQSRWFTAWALAYSSRIRMDFNLAASTVYNTFPFPILSPSQTEELAKAGTALLELHHKYTREGSTLADIYDPNAMPEEVRKAHTEIDLLVLDALELKRSLKESDVIESLAEKYSELAPGESRKLEI